MAAVRAWLWGAAAVWACLRGGILAVDAIAKRVASLFPPLRTSPCPIRPSDAACLAVNSALETAFVVWAARWAGSLPRATPLSPVGAILLFLLDDALYAPFHRLLHSKALYPLIHARHHRAVRPGGGYSHAAMEHPIEMGGALLLHACALFAAAPLLDGAAVGMHVAGKALVSVLNHCGRDVRLGPLYASRLHHAHHARGDLNFSQACFLWDRAWGTYDPEARDA